MPLQRGDWVGSAGGVLARAAAWGAVFVVIVGCGSSDNSPFRGTHRPDAGEAPDGDAQTAATGGSRGTGGTKGTGAARSTGGATGAGGASASSGGAGDAGAPLGASCQANADCAGGVCDPLSSTCVGCLFDADCGAGSRCRNKTCETITACTNSLDCRTTSGQPICDATTGTCEECVTNADCTTADCVDHHCVPYVPCRNSLACGNNAVCDTAAGRCVGCLTNADCDAGSTCVANQCVKPIPCASDRQCTSLGLLCNAQLGACVQCIQNGDCPAVYHCSATLCVLDVCQSGQTSCQNGAVATCNAVGDGYDVTACGPRTTCSAQNGTARCAPWVCEPGTNCNVDTLVTCTADGLTVETSTDCTKTGQHCVQGACSDLVCTPDQYRCNQDASSLCNAQGTGYVSSTPCGTGEYCNSSTGLCSPTVCQPGKPACNANVATTCNADGSGYAAGGKDCGAQVCVAGACQPLLCTPNAIACVSGNPVRCAADGLSQTTLATCTASQYCNPTAGTCVAQICTPNQLGCDGNTVSTCNATGSGWLTGGTACPQGQVCSGGACVSGQPCGSTVCPGTTCATVGSTCLYMASLDGLTTKTAGQSTCAALGTGWGLCPSTTICTYNGSASTNNPPVTSYLTSEGCTCQKLQTQCGVPSSSGSNIYVLASDQSFSMWTRAPCSSGDTTCAVSATVTTGAVLCCH